MVEIDYGGGVMPLSLIAINTDFNWLFLVIWLIAAILVAVSSFRMHSRAKVREFHVAAWLSVILAFLESVLVGVYYLVMADVSIYFPVPIFLLPIVPTLLSVFFAGSLIVFGVALRRVAGYEAEW
jgi:tryptophan-rich sensory protein